MMEFPRFSGHLTRRARWARKDGVQRAQDPTRVPAGVPPRGGADAARRPHPARALREPRRVRADAAHLASPGRRRPSRAHRHPPTSAELEELRALRKENARLKQERDLLKRAAMAGLGRPP